eukprot:54705-Chlamydomonas_euryale.AAC.2
MGGRRLGAWLGGWMRACRGDQCLDTLPCVASSPELVFCYDAIPPAFRSGVVLALCSCLSGVVLAPRLSGVALGPYQCGVALAPPCAHLRT